MPTPTPPPPPPLSRITSREVLHQYLYAAMQLEHATIPTYLTTLYSMHPGTNSDAYHVIRVVAVEEMLHLTLAANLLNAVGGKPDLTGPDFVPTFPAYLPDGEDDFEVSRQRFCKDAIDMFLKIERPGPAPTEEDRVKPKKDKAKPNLASLPDDPGLRFFSIGEFYVEIDRGVVALHEQLGQALFKGDRSLQVTPDYYYSGGGEVIPVHDLKSARRAINLIAEQGEGLGGGIYDDESELAHYFRFKQMLDGYYYQKGDSADKPTGPELAIDWDAVYPIKTNAGLADFPDGSELHAAALDFNVLYADFLGLITRAFNGQPQLLIDAVAGMFRLRDKANLLIRNPIPGSDGVNGAPTFELAAVAGKVAS
jgi:hypothetical protein